MLPVAVAGAAGVEVRTATTVVGLVRRVTGWRVDLGTSEALDVDGVVVAVPAAPAARLLRPVAPAAAAALGGVPYASVALVTYALCRRDLPRLPPGTGFLVPPVEGRLIKASTFSSAKWGWLAAAAPDLVFVRVSVGRYGEERDLQRDDADLAGAGLDELADALGWPAVPRPVDVRVDRWGGALPQYLVGHRSRVTRVRAAVAAQPGLAVCGAAYDGVGIPACVASGAQAAEDVLASLAHARSGA
jgi:oxygen-dependent protoporphyrinogen oxidase